MTVKQLTGSENGEIGSQGSRPAHKGLLPTIPLDRTTVSVTVRNGVLLVEGIV